MPNLDHAMPLLCVFPSLNPPKSAPSALFSVSSRRPELLRCPLPTGPSFRTSSLSPLQSALTKSVLLTPLESALTEKAGGGTRGCGPRKTILEISVVHSANPPSKEVVMDHHPKRATEPVALLKTSIAPMLSVRNGPEAIDFYQSAFGANILFRIDNEGTVVARLAVDGAEFWVADESPQHQNFSPETLGGGTVRMVLTVADPDAVFDRAVAAGAAVVMTVDNRHGWRLGRIAEDRK